MKTVTITAAFAGYPNGRTKRDFVEGEEAELSNEFADLIIGKGLAREASAKPSPKPAPAKAETAPAPEKDDTL